MEKENIILDCDPGHDDAIAIMIAAKNPKINLKAITVVSGNQTIEKTSQNALKVCSELGIKNIPIASGMSRPLVKERVICDEIHGVTGLDGPKFHEPNIKLDSRNAIDLIIDILKKSTEKITLVATGPCTNIAMAIRKEPKILSNIKQIVLMGGGARMGNITPAAEFNIFTDPEAAHIVFSCGRPITMIGLDVTRKALATKEVIKRIGKINNKASKLFVDLMSFFAKTQKEIFGLENPPVHDPLTIAYLIDPSVVKTKLMNVEIELRGEKTYGRTVCDIEDILKKPKNVDVALELDFEKFWNIVYNSISLY